MSKKHILASVAFLSVAFTGIGVAQAQLAAPAAATTPIHQTAVSRITEAEVLAAQQAWGRALVEISTTYDERGLDAARQVANRVIDSAYGYQMGPVLFKPTLTTAPQTFRTTRAGALAYFIGNDPNFPNDTGFALKHWRSVEINNAGIFLDGDVAISMGNVTITDRSGNRVTVDKTWGYKRDQNGNLRIVLHHSSLPYRPS